jgi:hypothetical protein
VYDNPVCKSKAVKNLNFEIKFREFTPYIKATNQPAIKAQVFLLLHRQLTILNVAVKRLATAASYSEVQDANLDLGTANPNL